MRYETTIDAYEFNDDVSAALTSYATAANATFTNVVELPYVDQFRFANDRRVAFDATPADVDRYVAFYELDPEYIVPFTDA